MLSDREFLENMWAKIEVAEEKERINKLALQEDKIIRNKRIKEYGFASIVSIFLILLSIYSDFKIIIAVSLIVMELVYVYENKSIRSADVGGI